jgi:nucleotide-binding universal stress UspA family protein
MAVSSDAIVVGTDGSSTASIAVDHAARMAASTGAVLHLVCAYNPLPGHGLSAEALVYCDPLKDAESCLSDAVALIRPSGVEVETHAVPGSAALALVEVAQKTNASMLVVGNKGMSGSRRFLLGSVPNKISHHAPCSVTIVRTS